MNNTNPKRRTAGIYGFTNRYNRKRPATEEAHYGVTLIGAALGLGAVDPSCSEGPGILRKQYPELMMLKAGIQVDWDDILWPDQQLTDDVIATIGTFCLQLAERVKKIIGLGRHFVVLGGDHSCAIGTWTGASTAIADKGPLGLIWIDAHLDAHTPETSPSGYVHGMPVASLLGYGSPALTNLLQLGPKLLPQHLCLIGGRCYEQEELNLLNKLGVRLILMEEVHKIGLEAALNEAVNIATSGTAGFGISIDLDAIHADDAPAVCTPAPGGIPAAQLISSLAGLDTGQKLIGYEIAEFNPCLDNDGRTARLICNLLVAMVANDPPNDNTSIPLNTSVS